MHKKRHLFYFLLLVYFLGSGGVMGASPQGTPLFYRVEKNETVGSILFALSNCGLWGKHHLVEQTLLLNHIETEDAAKKLMPGRILTLPLYQKNGEVHEMVFDQESAQRLSMKDHSFCEGKVAFYSLENQAPPAVKPETVVITESVLKTEPEVKPEPEIKAVSEVKPETVVVKEESSTPKKIERSPTDEERALSWLGLVPYFKYFQIKSTDKSSGAASHIISRLSPGLDFFWILDWTKDFKTIAKFSFERYILNQYSAYKSIEDPVGNRVDMNFIALYKIHPAWIAKAEVGIMEGLFLSSLSSSSISLDVVPIKFLGVGLSHTWYQNHGINLTQNLGLRLFLPVTQDLYTLSSGFGYETNLQLSHFFTAKENKMLFMKVSYDHHDQNSSIINNVMDSLVYGFGYEWKIGDEN